MSLIPAIRPPKNKKIPAAATILGLLAALGSIALAAQDRFTLKAPNGIAFSEFRGYENWPDVAPSTLKYVEFIEKDSKRFSETNGWGCAEFLYDAASDTFTEKGALPERAVTGECHACHTIMAAKDYIFTAYPKR